MTRLKWLTALTVDPEAKRRMLGLARKVDVYKRQEYIFSLSEVQRDVRHMAITHTSQANREKELKADGTISSERHAD